MKTYNTRNVCADCRHRSFVPTSDGACPVCSSARVFAVGYRVRVPALHGSGARWAAFCDRFGGAQLARQKSQQMDDAFVESALAAARKSPEAFRRALSRGVRADAMQALAARLADERLFDAFSLLLRQNTALVKICRIIPPESFAPDGRDPCMPRGSCLVPWNSPAAREVAKHAPESSGVWNSVLYVLTDETHRRIPSLLRGADPLVRDRFLDTLAKYLFDLAAGGNDGADAWFRGNRKLFDLRPLHVRAEHMLDREFRRSPKTATEILRRIFRLIGPLHSQHLCRLWATTVDAGLLTLHEYVEIFSIR